ncbi:MAG: phospholipase [Planctomycetota bacterium]|nr:MAG: phospholipase [Planctomycetota bacterium]
MTSGAACRSTGGGSEFSKRLTQREFERRITRTVAARYWLYLPPEYDSQPGRRWPLVLFLHGAGERGDDLERVKIHGPAKRIAAGEDFPFILVAPQCPAEQWWDTDTLIGLLDDVTARLRVDSDRVYVTGLSMGGFGTWDLATRQPERFAAIAPICGGGRRAQAARLVNVPIWAFHGALDEVVPVEQSKRMVDAVNAAGGHATLTIYPDAHHDSWTRTYDNPAFYEWLLAQRRGQPPTPPPDAPASDALEPGD